VTRALLDYSAGVFQSKGAYYPLVCASAPSIIDTWNFSDDGPGERNMELTCKYKKRKKTTKG